MPGGQPAPSTRFHLLVLLALAGPFYVNDFASIYVQDWRLWLLIDYVLVKAFPLLVAYRLVRSGALRPAQLGLTPQGLRPFLLSFLIVALLGTLIDQNGYRLSEGVPGYPPLGGMPAITSPAWNWIDLTVGLLLVGVVEELVFRGYVRTFIARFTSNPGIVVLVSALAFGLIHWSLGLQAVLVTTVIGAVFMAAYLKTGSLPAIMLAHFAVNFIDFAGVVPKSIFRLA